MVTMIVLPTVTKEAFSTHKTTDGVSADSAMDLALSRAAMQGARGSPVLKPIKKNAAIATERGELQLSD
jgi:hypothetical protein